MSGCQVNGQISFFERIPPLCKWEYNIDEDVTTQTQGRLICGRCKHFLGFTGMYSWRLTPEQAEDEAKEVWCANIGHGGYCPECGAYVGGAGVINQGIKNYHNHNSAGIHNMPFSDEELNALDEAAKKRALFKIKRKVKAPNNKVFTFEIEIGSFRSEDYDIEEDYSYFENLWEDPCLIVYVDISSASWGHGFGEKFGKLCDLGAKRFVARALNVVMQQKGRRNA